MVFNPDYDLARPLASALKATAPYVGIPIPGHAPLIFKRSKLQNALRGVKPIYIDVAIDPAGERFLTVEGVASARGRTFMRMRSIHREAFQNRYSEPYNEMQKWNPLKKAAAPRTSKYDKALAKLEKQLAKLGDRPQIENPCLSHSTVDASNHAQFSRWHEQKDLRRKIGTLALQAYSGKITAHEFYVKLALLTTVKRYSDFTEKQREKIIGKVPFGHNGFMIYVQPKNLWKFLPDLSRSWTGSRPRLYWGSWQEWQAEQTKTWGNARYQVVLDWSHQRREILSQMQGIRDMQPAPAI